MEPDGEIKKMGKWTQFKKWTKKLGKKMGQKFSKFGNKVSDWAHNTFSDREMDEDDDDYYYDEAEDAETGYYYYEYDENLADEIDEEKKKDTADTEDMIGFMYPLMEGKAKFITPLMEATQGFVGGAWKKVMDSVGLSESAPRRRMEDGDNAMYEDSDYYDEYYEDEEEDEDEDVIDGWYDDETGMDWIVMNEDADEQYMELDADAWDLIDKVMSDKTVPIDRKCMNVFGTKICICEFLAIIGAKPNRKVCRPKYGPGSLPKPKPVKTKKKPKPSKLPAKGKTTTPKLSPKGKKSTPQKTGKVVPSKTKKLPTKPKAPPVKAPKTKGNYVKPIVKPGDPTPKPYKMKKIPPKTGTPSKKKVPTKSPPAANSSSS